MKLVRKLLLPLVPVYWLITWLRNLLYDLGVFTSAKFDFPVICVGNLSVGGTGKTPMVMYLLQLLSPKYQVATLSRGYKRKSKGFQLASMSSNTEEIGDEPLLFKKNFPKVEVAVDGNRTRGISQLRHLTSSEIVLLDDAFQHRKVQAGLNILLTKFDALYPDDWMLPTGDLREPVSGARRADIVVVTKCPETMTDVTKAAIQEKLKLQAHQKLFFSFIAYAKHVKDSTGSFDINEILNKPFLLVTGIANASPLVHYLQKSEFEFTHQEYADHHDFTASEIAQLKSYDGVLLTTEKDYWRLQAKLPQKQLYYLPIETKLFDEGTFNELVFDYLTTALG